MDPCWACWEYIDLDNTKQAFCSVCRIRIYIYMYVYIHTHIYIDVYMVWCRGGDLVTLSISVHTFLISCKLETMPRKNSKNRMLLLNPVLLHIVAKTTSRNP